MHKTARIGDLDVEIDATAPAADGRTRIALDGDGYEVVLRQAGTYELWLTAQGPHGDAGTEPAPRASRRQRVFVASGPEGTWIGWAGRTRLVRPSERLPRRGRGGDDVARPVTPPMPAVVTQVLVEVGQAVDQGQALVVVTAMKMEMTLTAPHAGTVVAVRTSTGAKVNPGEILVEIERPGSGDGPDEREQA